MSFLDGSDEARQFLATTNDPAFTAVRQAAEVGQVQPAPLSAGVVGGSLNRVTLARGEAVDLPLPLDLEQAIGALDSNSELRAMLVIRERSVTDNTFSVHLELGVASSINEPASEDEEGFVTELFFFDHVDGEQHLPGHVLTSDQPLGHYRLDATDAVRFLAESSVATDEVILRVTVRPVNNRAATDTEFTIGGVTIELFQEVL
ncbi:MAG: hypothetical protein AAGA21_03935 [Pseudomonadota bacterium]